MTIVLRRRRVQSHSPCTCGHVEIRLQSGSLEEFSIPFCCKPLQPWVRYSFDCELCCSQTHCSSSSSLMSYRELPSILLGLCPSPPVCFIPLGKFSSRPAGQRIWLVSMRKRAFSVVAPLLWNSLPRKGLPGSIAVAFRQKCKNTAVPVKLFNLLLKLF